MKNWKKYLIIAIVVLTLAGCGAIPTLKNGEQKVASYGKSGISAEQLYDSLKNKYGAEVFVDLFDTAILDKKYKETSAETSYVNSQIDSIKESAKENKMEYTDVLKYYGFKSTKEAKAFIKLNYRRDLAVNDYLKSNIKDSEIKKYYETEVYGNIKLKHILISPNTSDDMTTEDKAKAEKEAKKTAESIIKKLEKGASFSKLAKKYSDDSATAKKGGDLGWVATGDMVEEFDNAAFKLKKGKYTTSPVKTTYGYHIIYKLDEKKKPTLKSVKKEIVESLAKEKLSSDPTLYYTALDAVRKDAGLKFEDKELKKVYNTYLENAKAQAKNNASNAQ